MSNCLFHPSVRQAVHEKYAKEVKEKLKWCRDNLEWEFKDRLFAEYNKLNPKNAEKLTWENFFKTTSKLLIQENYKVLVMNGKSQSMNQGVILSLAEIHLEEELHSHHYRQFIIQEQAKIHRLIRCGSTVECLDMIVTLE